MVELIAGGTALTVACGGCVLSSAEEWHPATSNSANPAAAKPALILFFRKRLASLSVPIGRAIEACNAKAPSFAFVIASLRSQ
jgi:hypothetical protein